MPIMHLVDGACTTLGSAWPQPRHGASFAVHAPFGPIDVSAIELAPAGLAPAAHGAAAALRQRRFDAVSDGRVYRLALIWTSSSQIEPSFFIAAIGPNVPAIAVGGRRFTVIDRQADLSELGPDIGLPAFARLSCIAAGTRVETMSGTVAVEELRPGDRVLTMAGGPQTLRWTGRRRLLAAGALAPITIAPGALGNRREMRVSQHQRILLNGWRAEIAFGATEMLAPAHTLIGRLDGVEVTRGSQQIDYHHLLFDRPEIVLAEGIGAESFHPAHHGPGALDDAARAAVLEVFPEWRGNWSEDEDTPPLALPRVGALGKPGR
ncbi:MAG: Hint domain-containing protein [Pseudomonadota bacterium]